MNELMCIGPAVSGIAEPAARARNATRDRLGRRQQERAEPIMQSSGSFGTEVSTRRADTSGKVGCSLHGRTVRRATFVNSQRQAPSTLTRQAIDRPMIASPAYRRLRVGAPATTPILTIVNARRRYGLISENCRETPIVTVWRIVMTHSRSLAACRT
jgi:hypothetical protein